MTTKAGTQHRKRRGFNLIESAIVLGFVGLVIGGIWTAASAVMENYKLKRVTEVVILASRKLQENISLADANAIPRTLGYAFLIDYCIAAKIFPEDFISGNKIITPFDNNALPSYTYANGGHINCLLFNNSIEIEVNTPNKRVCLKLTSFISSRFKDRTILDSLAVFGYDNAFFTYYPGTLGWPLSTSGTQCNRIYPANIRLRFNFLRNN